MHQHTIILYILICVSTSKSEKKEKNDEKLGKIVGADESTHERKTKDSRFAMSEKLNKIIREGRGEC